METTLVQTTTITSDTLRDFVLHLRATTEPFAISKRGTAPRFADRARHEGVLLSDPVRYALLGLLPDITEGARARIAFLTLAQDAVVSQCGAEASAEIEAATGAALCLLSADVALQVFLSLRRARINRKRVSRLAVRFLVNHPAAEFLWRCRRPAVADVLEHALGRDVLRACVRFAGNTSPAANEVVYLQKHLLRFAHDPAEAKELLAGLATGADEQMALHNLPSEILKAQFAPEAKRPSTVTATDRGNVTAALTALYRQTPMANLATQFAQGLTTLAVRSPRFAPGFRVALVLDTSTSLQGYGEREYCLAASTVTLWRLLCRASAEPVAVFGVGDDTEFPGSLPVLGGGTDIATALLDALETKPDLVLIVSDGYENRNAGDLARVVATLPQVGIETPVLFCSPLFTSSDDRTYRRPAPKLADLPFWHEDELPGLLQMAWLYTPNGASGIADWIRTALLAPLKEKTRWIQQR